MAVQAPTRRHRRGDDHGRQGPRLKKVMSKWVEEPDYGDGDDDDDHSDGASELLAVDPLSAGALRHHLRPLRRPWCP